MSRERAIEIVQAIYRDLHGRRGLRQTWDDIDADIQEEILEAWTAIVETKLKEGA